MGLIGAGGTRTALRRDRRDGDAEGLQPVLEGGGEPRGVAALCLQDGNSAGDPAWRVGALFAFAVSFDEVIAVFLTAARQRLPVQIFSGTSDSITPTITAAATC